ncbi:MAG: HlyD family efflux transporter periplasmic adaptor subunit [Lachnospiraceae bacterium]|nr:HlyD family efflux transporter periplasmic adaptor subunit [Lachnospiraceae bacterium]
MSSVRRKLPLDKKNMVKAALMITAVLAAILILITVLRSKVSSRYGQEDESEILTANVTMGNISTTVSGSGTLSNDETENITIPGTVELTEVYVNAGDTVKKGDMLASVNSASVIIAMNEIQEQLNELDKELADISSEEAEDKIMAGVSGRIKKIYTKKENTVADVMYENQALMLISVDGYMAVDVETDALSVGSSVTVKDSDGTKYTGTVDSVWGGKATILITDNGTVYGDKVTVSLGDDKTAEGTLYIHECVKVTGYAGTVSSVNVSENQKISKGKTLLYLDDVSGTVNYASVLEEKETYEKQLQTLIKIYKEGAVYAQNDGVVTSVTEVSGTTVTTTTASSGGFGGNNNMSTAVTTLEEDETQDTVIGIAPSDYMLMSFSVDESDILSLTVGQQASVSIESLGDDTFSGKVTKINKEGTSSNGVTSYSASILVERGEGMLSGMSASAVIMIEGKENALLIPEEAVNRTSSTAYVYTSYDEESREFGDMVEVTIGISNGNYVEITGGLEEGDTVYYQESQSDEFGNFGGFGGGMAMPGGFGGDMPGGFGSDMPSGFDGGGMSMPGGNPSGNGNSQRPGNGR